MRVINILAKGMFQHTAARRRLDEFHHTVWGSGEGPHTAARRRLAVDGLDVTETEGVSTHSRPKAAGWNTGAAKRVYEVSTHSRPKAAGTARRRYRLMIVFQHTAARRRLGWHIQA